MKRFLRSIACLAVLLLYAVVAALAFPNFISEKGVAFLAFFFLIPVFFIIDISSLAECFIFGPIYGFVFYTCYNYWLSTFHPLAIFIAPILEAVQYLFLFPALKLTQKIFKIGRAHV